MTLFWTSDCAVNLDKIVFVEDGYLLIDGSDCLAVFVDGFPLPFRYTGEKRDQLKAMLHQPPAHD